MKEPPPRHKPTGEVDSIPIHRAIYHAGPVFETRISHWIRDRLTDKFIRISEE